MDIEIGRGDLHYLIILMNEDISKDEAKLEEAISENDRAFLGQYISEHKELLNNLYTALNAPGVSTITVRERQQ